MWDQSFLGKLDLSSKIWRLGRNSNGSRSRREVKREAPLGTQIPATSFNVLFRMSVLMTYAPWNDKHAHPCLICHHQVTACWVLGFCVWLVNTPCFSCNKTAAAASGGCNSCGPATNSLFCDATLEMRNTAYISYKKILTLLFFGWTESPVTDIMACSAEFTGHNRASYLQSSQ
jgi:hypothetical protein